MPNKHAIALFNAAREHYLARRFAEARASLQRYRQSIDYHKFEHTDQRPDCLPTLSVVIVSNQGGQSLLDCLKSVFDLQGPSFEILLVDNGGNQSIHAALTKLPLLWIRTPINLLPSEGRNVGAHFARSDLLVFLDDDALMAKDYLAIAYQAMKDPSLIGLRGRIFPKASNTVVPEHYDLGSSPYPAEFNLEGNMVIRYQAFRELDGFDPLMFGHEGKELTLRCKRRFPGKAIMYWPELSIQHEFAIADRLHAKRQRQALGQDYLDFLQRVRMNSGVSILVRAGDNLTATKDVLESLSMTSISIPFEVLIWASNSIEAISIIRDYLPRFSVRVLSSTPFTLLRLGLQARYDRVLLLDLPISTSLSSLNNWLDRDYTDSKSALFVHKQQLLALRAVNLDCPLTDLATILGNSLHQQGDVQVQTTNDEIANGTVIENAGQITNTMGLGKAGVIIHTETNISTDEGLWDGLMDGKKLGRLFTSLPVTADMTASSTVIDPDISIIIPVYNKAEHISAVFNSLLNNDCHSIEILCIDDCSTDGSKAQIQRFADKDPRVKLLSHPVNMGAARARNTGLQAARGAFTFFLDADDYLDMSVLQKMHNLAIENGADIIRGRLTGRMDDGTHKSLAAEHLLHDGFKSGVIWKEEESLWWYWYFSANLYKTDFLKRERITFPTGLRNEDPFFLCRALLAANKICLVPDIVYYYTIGIEQQNKTPTLPFLIGWSMGNYYLLQLIATQEKQVQYYLTHFMGLLHHSRNSVMHLNKDDAYRVLSYIIHMFKRLNYDFVINSANQPWARRKAFNSADKEYIHVIKKEPIAGVYNYLLGK